MSIADILLESINATSSDLIPRLAPLRQVKTDLLDITTCEARPADGEVVILLHGWPYGINSYIDVAPDLASAGIVSSFPNSAAMGRQHFCTQTPSGPTSRSWC
jgi:hypothetical protein